jgi:hypothetical protein
MITHWDGITKSKIINEEIVKIRHQLADAAKMYNWQLTLEILKTNANGSIHFWQIGFFKPTV